jgi:hypothetical protein
MEYFIEEVRHGNLVQLHGPYHTLIVAQQQQGSIERFNRICGRSVALAIVHPASSEVQDRPTNLTEIGF